MKTQGWKVALAMLPVIFLLAVSLYVLGFFGEAMPEFALLRTDGRVFTKDNLRPGIPTVIIYVDVTCDDCQKTIQGITLNHEKFENSQILIVSPQNFLMIQALSYRMELNKFPFITVLLDNNRNFDMIIKAKGFPTVAVYSKNRRLIRKFDQGTFVPGEEIARLIL